MMGRWPPDARDTSYRGPYPIQNLHQARGVLIRCLQDQGDLALQPLLRKIGIDLPNQCIIPSPLLPIVRNSSPFPIVKSHTPSNLSRFTPNQGAMSARHTTPQMCTPRRPFLLEPPRPHLLFTPVRQQLHSRPIQRTPMTFTPGNHPFTCGDGENNVRMGHRHHYSNGLLEVRSHKETQSIFSILSAGDNQPSRVFDQSNHGAVMKSLTDEDISTIKGNECVPTIRTLHEVDISSETLKQILANKVSVDEDISSTKRRDSTAEIHNLVDVNISCDILKKILASVGQTHQNHVEPQCAEPDHQALDDPPQAKVTEGENENQVSHTKDFNSHNTLQQDINSSREYEMAFVSSPSSDSRTKNFAKNSLNIERTNHVDGIGSNMNNATQEAYINNSSQTENILPMFKCDYCRFTTQYLNDMSLHLTDSNHLSGSEYLAKQLKSCQLEVLYTERVMAVKNTVQTRKNNTVIACPECRKTFDDIFMCSQHFKYEHKSTSGYYVICPVIHSVFIPLELSPVCSACHDRFASWQALCDHWIGFPNHSPLPASSNRQIFHQFVCPTCGFIFSENFVDAVMQFEIHFQEEHSPEANCKTKLVGIETKQVMLPTRKEKQHDFNPHLTSNGIRDEICVLKQLCASGTLTSGLLAAEARIKELYFRLSTS